MKLGLIAGNGRFPFLLLDAARAQGFSVAVAAIREETDPEIDGRAAADALFADPLHPYTLGLIETLPDPAHRAEVLPVIPGGVPNLDSAFTGCRFADRWSRGDAGCRVAEPPLEELAPRHWVACFKARQG